MLRNAYIFNHVDHDSACATVVIRCALYNDTSFGTRRTIMPTSVADLRCEYRVNPLGIEAQIQSFTGGWSPTGKALSMFHIRYRWLRMQTIFKRRKTSSGISDRYEAMSRCTFTTRVRSLRPAADTFGECGLQIIMRMHRIGARTRTGKPDLWGKIGGRHSGSP